MNPKPYTSIRAGHCRIEYDPSGASFFWSPGDPVASKPFKLFIRGDCINHYATFEDARKRTGIAVIKWSEWK